MVARRGRSFPDKNINRIRCECFFASEGLKATTEGRRGVQLADSFDEGFRCPSTVRCILETKSFYTRHVAEELPPSLTPGWMSDPACPFGSCEFGAGGDSSSSLLSCERGFFSLPYPNKPCHSHHGAEFCVRSDQATYGGEVTGHGNQVKYKIQKQV